VKEEIEEIISVGERLIWNKKGVNKTMRMKSEVREKAHAPARYSRIRYPCEFTRCIDARLTPGSQHNNSLGLQG